MCPRFSIAFERSSSPRSARPAAAATATTKPRSARPLRQPRRTPCGVRKFGRTVGKRLFAGKTRVCTPLHACSRAGRAGGRRCIKRMLARHFYLQLRSFPNLAIAELERLAEARVCGECSLDRAACAP